MSYDVSQTENCVSMAIRLVRQLTLVHSSEWARWADRWLACSDRTGESAKNAWPQRCQLPPQTLEAAARSACHAAWSLAEGDDSVAMLEASSAVRWSAEVLRQMQTVDRTFGTHWTIGVPELLSQAEILCCAGERPNDRAL